MAKLNYRNGFTSVILRVKIMDTASTVGAGKTGLTSASSGLIISTIADNEATATAYTVAGSTIETITTLGTFAAPTATKCRFKEVDATNHPGLYEIQIADARWAVSNARSVIVTVSGATGAAQVDAEIQLEPVPADVQTIKTNPVVNGGTVTFPSNATLASTTNITAGTITTVTTTTNLTNLPAITAGWLTAAGIANDAITAGKIATGAIDADALAADAVTEIWGGITDSAGVTTLLSRLTATRAGYIDNLSSGLVATAAQITALQVNTRANLSVPIEIETPDASTQIYKIRLHLFDVEGNMEAPDSTPTVTLTNAAGTDCSSRLSVATNPSTGVYTWDYTATAGDAEEQLIWAFTVVEGGLTRTYAATSYVVEETAYRFSSTDRANLVAVKAKTDNLPLDPADASDVAASFVTVNNTLATIAGYIDTEIAAILAAVTTEVAEILADTNELQTDWTNGGRLDLLVDGVKAKTDSLTFTTAGRVDSTVIDKTGFALVDVDGVTFTNYVTAFMAVLLGQTVVTGGNQVEFKKRDGTTTIVTITYGATTGQRTGSAIS